MNGSCAGGTGAFIDQMATLLDVTVAELDRAQPGARAHLPHRLPLRRIRQDGHSAAAQSRARARRTWRRQHLPGRRQPDHRRSGAGPRGSRARCCSSAARCTSSRACSKRFQETLKLDDDARASSRMLAPYAIAAGAAHVRRRHAEGLSRSIRCSRRSKRRQTLRSLPTTCRRCSRMSSSTSEFKTRHAMPRCHDAERHHVRGRRISRHRLRLHHHQAGAHR